MKVFDILRKRLAEKNINKTIAIYMILQFLSKKFGTTIKGVLKNNVLYIKVGDPHIAFQIFIKKRELIDQINKKLYNLGYGFQIKDIRKSRF